MGRGKKGGEKKSLRRKGKAEKPKLETVCLENRKKVEEQERGQSPEKYTRGQRGFNSPSVAT